MPSRRPALIFDFGNVLAFFDYDRFGARLGQQLGLSGSEVMRLAREAGFTPLLRRYESGLLTAEKFGREVCGLVGLELTHDKFVRAFADIFQPNEPVIALAAVLKEAGYPLVLGSNTNDIHASHFRERFAEALAPFDALVLSHEVGHVKPSPEFYLACARAADAPPDECVFIDDMQENVEGALGAGLLGLRFLEVPSLVADLRAMGVQVPEAW